MNYFWVTVGNTPFERKRFGLEELPYPLACYAPSTAFSHGEERIILPSERSGTEIGFELAVKTDRRLFQADKSGIESAVGRYYLCAGLSNNIHLDKIYAPTIRDKGVCEYYSRWNDNANCLIELPECRWEDLLDSQIRVEAHDEMVLKLEYLHNPVKILSFLSSFTPLFSNTFICLGQLGRLPVQEKATYTIKLKTLDFEKTLTVCQL